MKIIRGAAMAVALAAFAGFAGCEKRSSGLMLVKRTSRRRTTRLEWDGPLVDDARASGLERAGQ